MGQRPLRSRPRAPGYYAPPGADPDADITGWKTPHRRRRALRRRPDVQDIIDEITTHHSSYYIDDSIPPAPLLISNGFTDDLFPVDEALRFYNRTRTEYPDAEISLFFVDFGHPRGAEQGRRRRRLRAREHACSTTT